MNHQRLRFALARGARIEEEVLFAPSNKTCWIRWRADNPLVVGSLLRIHPADVHLEYGPLSTALRNLAIYGGQVDWTGLDRAAMLMLNYEFLDESEHHDTPIEWNCCALMLAEHLADMGL